MAAVRQPSGSACIKRTAGVDTQNDMQQVQQPSLICVSSPAWHCNLATTSAESAVAAATHRYRRSGTVPAPLHSPHGCASAQCTLTNSSCSNGRNINCSLAPEHIFLSLRSSCSFLCSVLVVNLFVGSLLQHRPHGIFSDPGTFFSVFSSPLESTLLVA